jgi:hypothetical protein
MSAQRYVMALFRTQDQATEAIQAIKGSAWKLHSAHSPFQSHKISEALALKKSKVGYFTLAGGILGFISGFALAIFTATRWELVISGKPVVALIPFIIVGFEFTILFSIFGNIIGLMVGTDLPRFIDFNTYDIRFSGESFGIIAACKSGEEESLADFFRKKEGEVRILDRPPKR